MKEERSEAFARARVPSRKASRHGLATVDMDSELEDRRIEDAA
jgi:hypothetical protein